MTPEIRMHPLDEVCLMCAKINEGPPTAIFETPDLMKIFNTVTGIQLTREEYLPENICFACSFTLYRMLEIQRTIKRNIMHFKMNYQYRNASEKSKLLLNTSVIRNSNPNGLIISDVRGQVQVADDHLLYSPYDETACLAGRSPKLDPASPSSNTSRASNLLRPIYMSVENIRDTESGGAMYSGTASFQCGLCCKIFSRRSHLTRHVNSHRAQTRASSRASTVRKKMVFKCRVCGESFAEKRTMLSHRLTHRSEFPCHNCLKVFYLQRELDWHQAECQGRTNAGRRKGLARHNTRLKSVALELDELEEEQQKQQQQQQEEEDVFRIESLRLLSKTPTLSEKLQSVQNWCDNATGLATNAEPEAEPESSAEAQPAEEVEQPERPLYEADDDARSTISRFTSVSQKTTYSCFSSRSYWSGTSISVRTDYSYKTAKTMQTLKTEREHLQSRRITRSVTNRIKKIDMEIKVRELPRRSFRSSKSQLSSRRHHDITKRAKLVKSNSTTVLPDAFTCDCAFTSKNLQEFMEHEIDYHNNLALFACRECKERFTQRRFLEKHKEVHNRIYTCVWCFTKFVNEAELKVHLRMHSLNSIACNFCEASFITYKELKEHLDDMHWKENEKSSRKSCILIRTGQKRRNTVEVGKEYRSIELPQRSPLNRRRTTSYSQYRAIRLGSVCRERSPDDMAMAPVEAAPPPREQIQLPVAMDICRYSTPSPQISEERGSSIAKMTNTPPPSLEELGLFDTNFPLTNGSAEHAEEDEEEHASPVASPTGRRKRSRSRITLAHRVTRQTLAQPQMRNGCDNILPPYESWPMYRSFITVKTGVLPQPCRMT
ncbi:zinc finger protein 236-like [Phlebotomus argentipes]|uniref:zinc finger protein 236-like n=1 Tax=Phlebotomus argentipes TaxID=94469 RepID=UPI002892A20A|nr:zinc finger protein 236-like [Phlebotomus argentipes]